MKYERQNTSYFGESNPNYRNAIKVFRCSFCGREIKRRLSEIKGKKIFCSRKCHDDFRRKPTDPNRLTRENMRGYNHPRWNGIKKFCKVCGKELIGRDQRRRGLCSPQCAKVSKSASKKADAIIRRKSLNWRCKQCGKQIEIDTSKRLRSIRKFCSQECCAIWKSENLSGPNSKIWKGGNKKGYGPEFTYSLKLRIRRRDHFTCQKCGIVIKGSMTEPALDVHHRDGNKYNNNQDNLISLCRSCHKREEDKMKDKNK